MSARPLLTATERGLYCAAGDFFVDPWRPVERAVVTHAHADHATTGCGSYLASQEGQKILRVRVGSEASIDTLAYGEARDISGVRVTLFPAGHVLGSAQVRLERGGEIWVVSGDYKVAPDPTCTAWEPVRCHTFISESTFGLPIYRWPAAADVFVDLDAWRRANADQGRASVVFAYALGKAQRLLAGVDASGGPIYCHGAVEKLNQAYRASGAELPETKNPVDEPKGAEWAGALIIAPPSAAGSPWMRRFGDVSTAFASGWMLIRGTRRRRAVDRGFVLSDHADWPDLNQAIEATGAERVLVTHGYTDAMVRWLTDRGLQAEALATRYTGEQDADGEPE